jgi:arsenate reductase
MKRILVLCTGNSARSQMGEGLFRQEGGAGYLVFSAGTKPSSVRPEAIRVMQEIGIDISGQRSKSIDEFSGESFEYVVTVCDNARDNCPVFPGAGQRVHWSLEDPAAVRGTDEERLDAFRRIRDQLRELIQRFYRDQSATAHQAIAERAYEIYVGRGGTSGHEVDDWLQAESELCEGSGGEQ